MIIQPQIPSGYTIFCDDIRHELAGKTTLVGTYSGELIAYGEGSVTIPQLCLLMILRDDPATFPKALSFRVFRQASTRELLLEANVDVPSAPKDALQPGPFADADSIKFVEARLEARFTPFVVTEPCQLKVRVFSGDDEIRLGALNIRLESRPTQA